MKKYLLTIILSLVFISSCYAGLVDGTNMGFVATAPIADPEGSNDTTINDTVRACKFTSPAGATLITEMGWYCSTNPNDGQDFELGIYTHDVGNDEPDALVGKTAATAITAGVGWKVVSGLSISISPSTVYWPAIQLDAANTTKIDRTAAGGDTAALLAPQTALPDPNFGVPDTTGTVNWAIYALYETVAGEAQLIMITE